MPQVLLYCKTYYNTQKTIISITVSCGRNPAVSGPLRGLQEHR